MDDKINQWLQTYTPIYEIAQVEEIHTERGTDTVKNLVLQRTGYENLPLKYINENGWYRQYQYMLLLKSESEIDEQRLNNLDWLDDLSDWLAEQNETRNFPILDGNKKITNISCANAITYEEIEDGSISVYGLQIYFNIKNEYTSYEVSL